MRFVPAWTESFIPSYVEALREGFHLGNAADGRPTEERAAEIARDPEGWMAALRDPSRKLRLPDGQEVAPAPATELWWVDDHKFIGAVEIRHELTNAMFAAYGGHFSIGLRPSMRGRRNGNQMVTMSDAILREAARLGVKRALVCCRTWNKASQAWCVASGGIFVDEVPVPYDDTGEKLRRFVIPVPDFAGTAEAA